MQENKYDDKTFFEKYSQMSRSQEGLAAAGEWPALRALLPDFAQKRVLDLGCGFGWHCQYAMQQGAASALGVDLSEKMLAVAREKNAYGDAVQYLRAPLEEVALEEEGYDVALSSLALHYVADVDAVFRRVHAALAPGGQFVFSVEHPIFTAYGNQDWLYDAGGDILCWPVDRYFSEGRRTAVFLGEEVTKYHRTLTSYLEGVQKAGFVLAHCVEPQPTAEMVGTVPGMADELRRPMMLLVAAAKAGESGSP